MAYDYADCKNGKDSLMSLWEIARLKLLEFAKEMNLKTEEIKP